MKNKLTGFCLTFFIAMVFTTCLAGNVRAASKSVTLFNGGAAQFELTSPGCPRVMIDVVDKDILQGEVTAKDILLVTHAHPDHYDSLFVDSFPGRALIIKEGQIHFNCGKITGIAATHTARKDDVLLPESGSNYIFLVEMNGLRIAHFGDIGQAELTEKQIQMLGKVDIAIMQFINPYSQMDMQNKKGFVLMEQLSPRLIIPTSHGRYIKEVVKHAQTLWSVYASEAETLEFNRTSLPEEQTYLIWDDGASYLMETAGLEDWKDR